MDQKPQQLRPGAFRLELLVFLIIAFLLYLPILSGRVPFPQDLVTGFSPWEGAFSSKQSEIGDLPTQMYPWRSYAARAIRSGHVPLWNPYILGGAPFVANAQSAVFYPLNILYYLLPTPAAWALIFPLHHILAGLFTALFLRSIHCTRFAAIAGGIAFSMCGFITVWRGYPMGQAAVWLPLICFSVVKLHERLSVRSAGLAGFAFSMPILAGHPETAIHVTLAGVLLAAVLWIGLSRAAIPGAKTLFIGLFAMAGVVAVGLSAIQLLPTLEWVPQGTQSVEWRWPPRELREILTFVSRDLSSSPNANNIRVPEGAAYAGGLTLVFAAIAIFAKKWRLPAIFFGALAFFSLQEVYGIDPVHSLIVEVPVLGGLKNWRALLIVDFSLAVLAAIGLSVLTDELEWIRSRKWQRAVLGSVAAAVPAVGIPATYLAWRSVPDSPMTFVTAGAAVFLACGMVLVWLRLSGLLRPSAFAIIVVALLSVDLITFSYGHVPFARADEIFPPAPLFDFLKDRTRNGADRVVSLNVAYGTNYEMMYGLRSPGGYDNTYRKARGLLDDYSEAGTNGLEFTARRVAAATDRRFDLMNTRYLVVDELNGDTAILATRPDVFKPVFEDAPIRVYENLNAVPPVFAVPAGGVEVYPEEELQLWRLKDPAFDPRQTVLVSSTPQYVEGSTDSSVSDEGRGEEDFGVVRDVNTIRIHGRMDAPGVLVVSEINYPGWVVRVNGRPAELLTADYALMGVGLGAGFHDIEFSFEPHSARTGGLLTAGTALALTLLCIGGGRLDRVLRSRDKPSARPLIFASLMCVLAMAVLGYAGSFLKAADDTGRTEDDPRMYLSATTVTAGESYRMRISGASGVPVRVRYTLNGGAVEEFSALLGPTGEVSFDVSPDTRKGTYRLLEFGLSESDEWIPADVVITVE